MAILDSGVVSMPMENSGVDLNRLRQRKSRSNSNGVLSDSASGTVTSPSDDVGAPDDVRERVDSVVEDAQETANLAGDNGGVTEIRETGGGGGGGDGNIDIMYTYRPSVPAHRRVRESPLSSDAIFKQAISDSTLNKLQLWSRTDTRGTRGMGGHGADTNVILLLLGPTKS